MVVAGRKLLHLKVVVVCTVISFGFYEHVSILHIGNASGVSLPPVWIFKGAAHDADLADDFAQFRGDSVYGSQKNGYFTAEHFLSVLEHFVRHAVSTRPLLFIMDGASSHVSEESVQYAKSNGIQILLLPSHTTHLLQVADVAVFRPFKAYWRAECNRLRAAKRLTCAPGDIGVKRSDILPAAIAAWNNAVKPANVISGFRRTGIYPFNPRAYLKTAASHNKSTSLTSLPPLLSPTLAEMDLPRAPILVELARSAPLADPPPPTSASTASTASTKKRVRRTLDTSAGVLLTGDATIALLKAVREEAEDEERAKKQKVEDRRVKRVEKERLVVEKKAAQVVKKAAREAAAAVKAEAKEERKRERAEAVEEADEDKENVSPNASPLVRAAPQPARDVPTVVQQRPRMVLMKRKSV